MENVLLERHRLGNYIINHEGKSYIIPGSKGSIVGKKEVPYSVYEYLTMFTTCFKNGELLIVAKDEDQKEALLENMYESEDYKINGLTKEEVTAILQGNYKKMESELNKITNNSTKSFVLEVAKEIKISSAAKQKFIKDWVGSTLSIEDIFKY